jgi:hypothetical protein
MERTYKMKTYISKTIVALALLALSTLTSQLSTAFAQGTAFTYQGQLQDNGTPANGSYDLQFMLYNTSVGGSHAGPILTNSATAVSNGLFTVTLDFEAGIFTGSNYWLDIAVRTNGETTFAELTPRQPLSPAPYAIYAPNAGLADTAASANSVAATNVSGILALAQLPGTVLTNGQTGVNLNGAFSGNGTNLTALNADNLSSGTVPLAQLSGITSNQLAVATWQMATNLNGGSAALASNVISGIAITNASLTNALITNSTFAGNGNGLTNLDATQLSSGVIPLPRLPGAVITNNDTSSVNLIGTFSGNGAGLTALNADNLSTGTVPLAQLSGITSNQLAVATWQMATNLNGGNAALASNVVSAIAITNAFITNALITNSTFAGNGNGLTNLDATQLSSGILPLARLPVSVVTAGETGVSLSGTFSGNGAGLTSVNAAALNGLNASNLWQTTGNVGTNPTNGNFLGTTDFQPIELRVNGQRGLRVEPDPRGAPAANIIGGYISNAVEQPDSGADFIGSGGYSGGVNVIHSNSSGVFIGAGSANQIGPNLNDAVIGGGFGNTIGGDGLRSVIGGGNDNTVDEFDSVIAGGQNNFIQINADHAFIGGGLNNSITGSSSLPVYGAIVGGFGNSIETNVSYGFIGDGEENTIQSNAPYSMIGCGLFNQIYGDTNNYGTSVIAGGYNGEINSNSWNSFIGGGGENVIGASSDHSVIVGGYENLATGNGVFIGGGSQNSAGGSYSTVPGGVNNNASGDWSFAAGDGAWAADYGSFVWADASGAFFSSTASNQFSVRAEGGARFVTAGAGMTLDGQAVVPSGNYVFAYSQALQIVTSPATFQDANFSNDAQTSGWTHTLGASQYTCAQTGLYLVQYTAQANIADSMSFRGALNSTEIPGSEAYANSVSFGTTVVISKTFLASVISGSFLTIQYTGNSSSDSLQGGGSGSIQPSISLTITRIQ